MSECDLSVLDYLIKAAIKLELTQDYGQDIYELEESEIAFRINQHYQVSKGAYWISSNIAIAILNFYLLLPI